MSHKAAALEEGVDQLGQWRERCADHVADLKACIFIFLNINSEHSSFCTQYLIMIWYCQSSILSRLKLFYLQQLLDDCNDRVNSRTNTEETCHQVYD